MSEEEYFCEICEEEFEKDQLNKDGRCDDCVDHLVCEECGEYHDPYNLNYNDFDGYNYCDRCFDCPHQNVTSYTIEPSIEMIDIGEYDVDLMVKCNECGETLSLCGRLESS